jgi:hypothetical protein
MGERPPHKEPYAVSYNTYRNHKCRCEGCTDHQRIQHREWRARALADPRKNLNRRVTLSKIDAPNGGRRWTNEDRAVALNPDYTTKQAAEILGRTPSSIRQYRLEQKKNRG